MLAVVLALGSCATNKQEKRELKVNPDAQKIPITAIEAQFDAVMGFGGIKKNNIAVEYYPSEDAVCLQFRQNYVTYNLFWGRDGRETFKKALDKYKLDYSDKKLEQKSKNSKEKYGKAHGFLAWQLQSFGELYNGPLTVEMGYLFRDKSPYFVVVQGEALHKDRFSEVNDRLSSAMNIYFTRAQAETLAEIFDPFFLRGLITTDTRVNVESKANKDDY